MDVTQPVIDKELEQAWLIRDSNADLAHTIAAKMLAFSEDIGYSSGQAKSLLIIANYHTLHSQYSLADATAKEALEIFKQLGDSRYTSYTLLCLGKIQKFVNNVASAYAYYQDALQILEAHPEFNITGGIYINIGQIFQYLGDYEKALVYLKKAQELREVYGTDWEKAITLNNIGILYAGLGNYESALRYYNESLALRKTDHDERGKAHVLNNIAVVLSKQGNYEVAIEKYQQALAIYQELGYQEGIAASQSNIADSYIHLGKYNLAIPYIRKAKDIYQKLGNTTGLIIALTNIVSAYSKTSKTTQVNKYLPLIEELLPGIEQKNYRLEVHKDISEVYSSLNDVENTLRHFKQFYTIDREILNEESDKRIRNLQIIHQVEQMQKDKEKADREAEIQRLKAEKLQQENDHKAKELTSLTLHLIQKNNLIERVTAHVEDTLATLDVVRKNLLKKVVKELKSSYMEEIDWKLFEEQFYYVHSDFIKTLINKYADLTPTELKICSLLKLQLSNKQIAVLMNVDVRTIEFHRVNIRKKMNLSKGDSLVAFLTSL